jgi:hypothetical protein
MNSLCNIYVRFLPKLRALYQQYAKIQWADDKTITALRMVGYWRFLQDKGSILDADFRLATADEVIEWNLDRVTQMTQSDISANQFASVKSTYGLAVATGGECTPIMMQNDPLGTNPDPFATLFLYQLFESLVRLAHHRLSESFPDSLILQVTRFLENSIFVDDIAPQNDYSIFRKSISTPGFDDVVTKYSRELVLLYLDFSGMSYGCSRHQMDQLSKSLEIDNNVDMVIEKYTGLMTARDLIIFLGERGFFSGCKHLTVMVVLLFLNFGSVARPLQEGEEDYFRKFFTSFTRSKVTFIEFVQTLAFVGSKLIIFEWPLEKKFAYVVEHLEAWVPAPPGPGDVVPTEEEEKPEPPPPPPPTRGHSRRRQQQKEQKEEQNLQ